MTLDDFRKAGFAVVTQPDFQHWKVTLSYGDKSCSITVRSLEDVFGIQTVNAVEMIDGVEFGWSYYRLYVYQVYVPDTNWVGLALGYVDISQQIATGFRDVPVPGEFQTGYECEPNTRLNKQELTLVIESLQEELRKFA